MLQMTEKRWLITHNLAFDMVKQETDPNEFGKVVAFLRHHRSKPNAKDMLTLLLQQLVERPDTPIRSEQTLGYYQQIRKSCEKHLKDISDADELMLILGWCMRLMRYYNEEPKRAVEEQRPPQKPKQIPKLPQLPLVQTPPPVKVPEKPKVKVWSRVNATILKNDRRKVMVQLQTPYKEEVVLDSPHHPGSVGTQIKVKVQAVNENGQVTKVIP